MANIDSWRSANRPSNKSLPGLLEKLNILPRPVKIDKDDSALDTWSESSVDGSPAHSLPIPQSSSTSTLSPGQQLAPTLSPGGSQYGSLSKANPISPGRRASVVHHGSGGHQRQGSEGQQPEVGSFLNRLTIVRAPSRGEGDREGGRRPSGGSGGSSPIQTTNFIGGGHHSREHSGSFSSSPATGRMSFAFSSFGQSPSAGSLDHRLSLPHSPFQGSHDDGLSSSPHVGVGPGGGGRQSYSSGSGGDREDARDLTPREVVDLARSTSRGQVGHGQAGGGHHRRTSSTGSAHSPGSLGGLGRQRIVPQAPMFPDSHQSLDEYEPVEFHPLEDDVMLPFDDRPDEVASLIAAERNRGLFKLLELALPSTSSSTAEPSEWSYADLVKYLTKTTREAASDKVWVATIRQAVQTRSEPLWEKLKGLLGIDEDDDWGEGESHLAGEQHAGSEGNSGGSIVLIEGLEEGGPDDEHDDDDQAGGDRRVSDEGDGFVTGGMFSPEGGLSASLPGSSSLGELEAIGESEEEESAAETSTSGPEKQRSTDSGRTLQAPTLPTLITTQPSPSSSFNNNASQLGLFASSSEAAKTPTGDVSPFSQPLTGFGQGSGVQTPHAATSTGSSPRLGSPDVRAPRRSFVGVSIVSSSTQADYHSPSSGPQSASASTGISPSVSSADFATSPTFPVHPPARRRTSVTRDDLQYGGNEHSDPLTERGPGNPLFPSSFSNLSLKPWSRPSVSGAHAWASSKENESQVSDAPAGGAVKDDNNRDWAREMIGLKAGEKLSNSALTVSHGSEYSRSSSSHGV